MSSSKTPTESKETSIFSQPWGTTWRKALVSAPRLVPDIALRFTSPEGPHPFVVKLPSRGKHHIPVYIFIPPNLVASSSSSTKGSSQRVNLPILLDFHGGGFVLGSCQEQAPFCAKLCRELNCVAITVDYRLGPYGQFPDALDDAEDILHAILDPSSQGYVPLRQAINNSLLKDRPSPTVPEISIDLDKTRLAISGFSSGGNIALNLILNIPATPPYLANPYLSPLPSTHKTPIPTLLFYPSLDARQLPHERPLPPGLDPPKGFFASLNLEAELMPTYLPRHLAAHPRASPGLVPLSRNNNTTTTTTEDLNTSPSTGTATDTNRGTIHASARILLILPEFDSLSEQSQTWVSAVRRDTGGGQELTVRPAKGMLHGWTQFPDPMLDERARREKSAVFEEAVRFVGGIWGHGEG